MTLASTRWVGNDCPRQPPAGIAERAFARLTSGRTFTEPQRQWLDRIREHLVQNLSIDREDFDTIPVLHRLGGWGAADRGFGGQLEPLLGTRIWVALIIEHLASGRLEKEILEDYPDLDPRDIQAALAYAAEITRERILPTAVGA